MRRARVEKGARLGQATAGPDAVGQGECFLASKGSAHQDSGGLFFRI